MTNLNYNNFHKYREARGTQQPISRRLETMEHQLNHLLELTELNYQMIISMVQQQQKQTRLEARNQPPNEIENFIQSYYRQMDQQNFEKPEKKEP